MKSSLKESSTNANIVCVFFILIFAIAFLGLFFFSSNSDFSQYKCQIKDKISQDYDGLSHIQYSGTAVFSTNSISFQLTDVCNINDVNCIDKYDLNEILDCWWNNQATYWTFSKPSKNYIYLVYSIVCFFLFTIVCLAFICSCFRKRQNKQIVVDYGTFEIPLLNV